MASQVRGASMRDMDVHARELAIACAKGPGPGAGRRAICE